MMIKKYFVFFFFISFFGFAQNDLADGLYANMKTNKGTILLELTYTKTPITVANFVTLAEGTNNFVSEKHKGKPYYNGLQFHRVIADFMVQGGDPTGTGSGGPGYKFIDEITDLLHDKPGVLSMANAGPGTNGSQFFITHKSTPWLDGKHTVFGYVIKGLDVVNNIQKNDSILSLTIIRQGNEAKQFRAEKIFTNYVNSKASVDVSIAKANEVARQKISSIKQAEKEKQAQLKAQKQKEFDKKYQPLYDEKKVAYKSLKEKATTSPTGLQYVITKKGSGKKLVKGSDISINYAGYFENGKLLDSNIEEVAKKFGIYDENRAKANGYKPMATKIGSKKFIPGFIESLTLLNKGDKGVFFIPSNLAWGERGAGNKILSNSNVIFEIEILE